MTSNRELPPIEEAAEVLNTRHLHVDMHARRQEAIIAGRSLLNVEQMARVLAEHRIECTGLEGVTCRACRADGWMPSSTFARHQAEAIRAAQLGEHA